jgi:hypothetical protein
MVEHRAAAVLSIGPVQPCKIIIIIIILAMRIYRHEPVFTIGRAPFVAGAIHVRNQIQAIRQRERARRRRAIVERVCLLSSALLRRFSIRPTVTFGATRSPASANA